MPKVKLRKSALQVQRTQLQLYKRLLPSLDMKRRQLTVEHERAKTEYAQARRTVDEVESNIGRDLPMLACADIEEGVALRDDGVTRPILVFGAQSVSDLAGVFTHRLTPTVSFP